MPDINFATKNGSQLTVSHKCTDETLVVHINKNHDPSACILHWGLRTDPHSPWVIPSGLQLPQASCAVGTTAIQTPFNQQKDQDTLSITLPVDGFAILEFVLFFPEKNCWDNNEGENYMIQLQPPVKAQSEPLDELKHAMSTATCIYEHCFQLDKVFRLAAGAVTDNKTIQIFLITNKPTPLKLHWGIARSNRFEWLPPPRQLQPDQTEIVDSKAAQTPFTKNAPGNTIKISMPVDEQVRGIVFVLFQPQDSTWINNKGGNFYIPLQPEQMQANGQIPDPGIAELTDIIIENEVNKNSWTLMHRYNLCHDLLNHEFPDDERLAVLFVWLRFSQIRQLDWQRNYNTQPRELSHSIDRLTNTIAAMYVDAGQQAQLLRLIIATLGHGNDGQRIRDEILHIMHRHHIKEISGSFMEEWHQKLHNNTTPDDVVICEAYIAFMHSSGSHDVFYAHLEQHGITRKRLENFERPIKSSPTYISHLHDALIYDFGKFLEILKAVHSGTDLKTAINAAQHLLGQELYDLCSRILHTGETDPAGTLEQAHAISRVRAHIHERLSSFSESQHVRDFLFLDLALDDFQRICIENLFSSNIDNDILVDLICVVLDQLMHTAANKELQSCRNYFNRLTQQKRFSQEWALQAKAACDRIERFLCTQTDRFYALFQPKAELLGAAFQADEWTISLFSEEISRGQLSFVLAQLIRHINPQLRSIANIGAWEIVSRYTASGRVCCVDSLSSVQFKSFDEQTIIVTDAVSGNEEIPDGVTAVITPDATDIVSHVAIRARNAQLLFATCYDSAQISHLRSLQGRMLQLDVTPGGDITVDENGITVQNNTISDSFSPDCMNRPELCDPIIDNDAFEPARVGAKSLNLRRLKTCLPDWIHVPYSSALPYFLTEHVFDAPENKAHLKTYSELLAGIDNPTDTVPATLKKLQQTIMRLDCPRTIESDIKSFISKHHGPDAADWPAIWQSIKLVWASKWNERAFISRRSRGIPHELLHIAVLIQQVVSAEYSFVIHTVNPFDRNRDEIYAEIVPGLGETLVGNYPGRAMSFACSKSLPNPKILMYPSKSFGLHGSGLIFRSDSNGEDLPGYAGAGLYDSIMPTEPQTFCIDYSGDRLCIDPIFQHEMMSKITEIGTIIENKLNGPQDIEGCFREGRYFVVQARPQVGL